MASRFMYVVRVKISVKDEKEWNRWHDKVHIPKVLEQPGFIQVRKFRVVTNGAKEAEYFVMYELRNVAAYAQYAQSEEGAKLRQEYLDVYGSKTKITRWAWQETFQMMK